MSDESREAGWYPDPTLHHPQRYHDGSRWTEHVADQSGTILNPDPFVPPPRVLRRQVLDSLAGQDKYRKPLAEAASLNSI